MPAPNRIQVYFTRNDTALPEAEFDALMGSLPFDLQQKVLEETGWEDQLGSLSRKIMLWVAMKQAGVDMTARFNEMQFSSAGKPFLPGAPHFSLANDGAIATCAISADGVLGIDVARQKPINLSDYREKMTFMEWREIYSHVIPLRRFYEFWTIKTSVIKADGTLKGIDVRDIYIQPDVAFYNARYWYINPVEIEVYGYLSFLVSANPHAEIEVSELNLSAIALQLK